MSEEQEILDYEAHNARTALKLNKAEHEIERLTAELSLYRTGKAYSLAADEIERLQTKVDALEGFIHTYTEGEFVDDLAAVKAGREALAATEQEGET